MSLAMKAALVLISASAASAQPVTLVSRSTSGTPGNGASAGPEISSDGRFVVFASLASNLVSNDTNGKGDVFIHDLQTGETTRVSVSSSGVQGNDHSGIETGLAASHPIGVAISADGRFVAFFSRATNLVSGVVPPLVTNIYVHDRNTGATTCVSVRADNGLPAGSTVANAPVEISADGRYVGFTSNSNLLVAGDTDSNADAFVRDRQLGVTVMVSVSSSGGQIGISSIQALSDDGRQAAFTTIDSLEPGDTNGTGDVYLHNLDTLASTRVSASESGVAFGSTAMSSDGRFVSYLSLDATEFPGFGATNLPLCVHDLTKSFIIAVNRSTSGAPADTSSTGAPQNRMSSNGRFVAFVSGAGNLAAGQSGNRAPYVRDTLIGTTTLIGPALAGAVSGDGAGRVDISGDGSVVVFDSSRSYPGAGDFAATDVFVASNQCTGSPCVDVTFSEPAAGSFLWSDADNWSSEFSDPVPNSSMETALFDRAGSYEVTIDENVDVGGLTVRNGVPILRALDTTSLNLGQLDCVCNPFAMDVSGPVTGPEPATLRLVQSESLESSGFTCVGNIGIGDGAGWGGKLHLFGSFLEAAGEVVIGQGTGAQGFLALTAGGALAQFQGSDGPGLLVVGRDGGQGEVSVSSAPLAPSSSLLALVGSGAVLGDHGRGQLHIFDGGAMATSSLVIGQAQDPTLEPFQYEGDVLIEGSGSLLRMDGYSGTSQSGAPNACVIGMEGDGRVILGSEGELRFLPSEAGKVASLVLAGGAGSSSILLVAGGGTLSGSPPLQMGAGAQSECEIQLGAAGPTALRSARVGIAPLSTSIIHILNSQAVLEVGDTDEHDFLAPCQVGVHGSGLILAENCSTVRLKGTEVGGFAGSFGRLSASEGASIFTDRCVVGGREAGAQGQLEALSGGLISSTELVLNVGATITGDRLTVTSIGSLTPPTEPCSGARGTSAEARIETADFSVFTNPFGGGAPAIAVPIVEFLPGASFGGTGPYDFDMVNSVRVRPGGASAGGLIPIGQSPGVGVMTINGNYTQTSNGLLEIDANPFDPGAIFGPVDSLTISGAAVLGGTLRVIIAEGAGPFVLDQSFQILTASTVIGAFHQVEAVGPDAAYECDVTYSETSVSIVVTLAPPPSCPGDANGDNMVNFDDISAVIANWLGAGPEGDADGSGQVNFEDINAVIANWLAACP